MRGSHDVPRGRADTEVPVPGRARQHFRHHEAVLQDDRIVVQLNTVGVWMEDPSIMASSHLEHLGAKVMTCIFGRPRGMSWVHTFHTVSSVSLMVVPSVIDVRFCLVFNSSRLSVCRSGSEASPADGSAIEKHAEDEPGFRTNVYGCTTTTHPMERRANALTSSSHALLGSMFQGSNGSCCGKAVLQHARRSGRKVIAVFHRLNFRSTDNLSAVEPSHLESMYVRKCRLFSLR